MKQTFAFILFIIISQIAFAQGKIQGCVFDSSTMKPLAFSTIGAVNKNYGCYTDTSGLFTLYFSELNDSIKISYVGYENINTTVKDLLLNSKIFLKPTSINIDLVVIRYGNKKFKKIDIGYFSQKYDYLDVLNYPVNLKAIYIPFPGGENKYIIESINIAYYNSFFTNCSMRAQLIKVDKDGKPGEIIFSKIIETSNSRSFRLRKAIVKLKEENIYMSPNGIFVAIEWIFNSKPNFKAHSTNEFGPYIGSTKTKQTYIEYLKVYNQSEWQQVESNTILNIGLTVKKII